MKFLDTLKKTVTSKHFYGEVIGSKQNIGFRFLAQLEVLVALFFTILLSIQVSGILPSLEQTASHILPEGAEIRLSDGVLRTNVNPISIPFPQYAELARQNPDQPRYIAVVDVSASSTVDDLKSRDTAMLITSQGIVTEVESGRVSIQEFERIKDVHLVIDRSFLVQSAAHIKHAAKFLPFIAFIVLWCLFYVLSLFTSLLYGVFAWIMFKVMKIERGFRQAFSIGLYSRSFAHLLVVLSIMVPLFSIPSLSMFLQMLFIVFMIRPHRLKNII